MEYPYDSLWINGRNITFQDILTQTAPYQNTFEQNTFAFIRDWLNDVSSFSLQTSGSTGTPKIINITRDQMISSALLTEQALKLQSGSYALLCLDPQFIAGKMMLVRSFVTRMRIMAVTPSAQILNSIPDGSIELAAMVPYQIQHILEYKQIHKLNNIRIVLAGGAALDEKTRHGLVDLTTQVYATYGMTETVSHVALQKVNGKTPDDHFVTLPGISIRLDDRDCLAIKAPYIKNEIVTNDIAEIVGNTGFRWLGRWDNVINTGGIKVIPEKVEAMMELVLKDLGLSHEFFLTGLPDPKLGQHVSLILKGNLTPYQQREILDLSRKKLPIYSAPREIYCLEQFHYTQNDKINRMKTVEMLPKRP